MKTMSPIRKQKMNGNVLSRIICIFTLLRLLRALNIGATDGHMAMLLLCPDIRELSWKLFSNFAEDFDWFIQRWCIRFGETGKAVAQPCPHLEELKLASSVGWPNLQVHPEYPFILDRSLKEMGNNFFALSLDEHSIYDPEFGNFGFTLGETCS